MAQETTQEPDVNTDDGFAAALEGMGLPPDGGDPDAAEPNEGDSPAGDAGTEQPGGDTSEESVDPEVAAFLAKYGGDEKAALKAAVEAQSVIGRQGQELGQLRTEQAKLQGQVEALLAQPRQSGPVLSNEQITEVATSRVEELGYTAAAAEAANVGHSTGDERAYKSIMEQWMIEDPAAAMDFNTDFRLWQREQRAAAAAPKEEPGVPAWAQRAEEQAAVEGMTHAIAAVAQERGVPADSPIIEQMFAALEGMPPRVLELVASENPEEAKAGVGLVMDRATILAGALPPKEDPVTQRKLAGSRIASGGVRPAQQRGADGKFTPDEKKNAVAELQKAILESDGGSVLDGLELPKRG